VNGLKITAEAVIYRTDETAQGKPFQPISRCHHVLTHDDSAVLIRRCGAQHQRLNTNDHPCIQAPQGASAQWGGNRRTQEPPNAWRL